MIGMWRRGPEGERGASAVIVSLVLVVVFMGGALAVDVGTLVVRRQAVRDAMDAGVLAGAALLPNDPDGARAAMIAYASENNPQLTGGTVATSFRCLIADNGAGAPDLSYIPGACDPGADGRLQFTCDRGLCMAPCKPEQGDACNTIVAEASEIVPFALAPVGGFSQSSTGVVRAGACSGYCGQAPKVPIDIGLIVDRTASMSTSDLANAQEAARAMLGYLDENFDHVALGVIHRSSTTSQCSGGGYGRSITTSDYNAGRGTWLAAPYPLTGFSSDYQRDGGLDGSSQLVKTINCLQRSTFSTSYGQTDIGSPINAMANLLRTKGRPGVKKVMIVETDGEANLPSNTQPCNYAAQRGAAAKASGIEVFTVGFGIEGKRCGSDSSGSYRNALVTKLLSDVATGPSDDNGCVPAENEDGDHFFCEPKSGDLRTVFLRVAAAITSSPRLVRLIG